MFTDVVGREIKQGDYVVQRAMYNPEKGASPSNCNQVGRVESVNGRTRVKVAFPLWGGKIHSVAPEFLVLVRYVDGKWTTTFDPESPQEPVEISPNDKYHGQETSATWDTYKRMQEEKSAREEPSSEGTELTFSTKRLDKLVDDIINCRNLSLYAIRSAVYIRADFLINQKHQANRHDVRDMGKLLGIEHVIRELIHAQIFPIWSDDNPDPKRANSEYVLRKLIQYVEKNPKVRD